MIDQPGCGDQKRSCSLIEVINHRRRARTNEYNAVNNAAAARRHLMSVTFVILRNRCGSGSPVCPSVERFIQVLNHWLHFLLMYEGFFFPILQMNQRESMVWFRLISCQGLLLMTMEASGGVASPPSSQLESRCVRLRQ